MKSKQIVVVAIVVAIIGCLLAMQPVALIKPKPNRTKNAAMLTSGNKPATSSSSTSVTVEAVSAQAKAQLTAPLAANITNTENSLKNASADAEKLSLEKQLAGQWDDVAQPAPAAFYYLEVARKTNDYTDWLNAGSRFNDAFKATQDTALRPAYVANAIEALKHATALKPADLDAKSNLGIAYVNQTALGVADPDGGSPMQGIMLLRDVVAKDPSNMKANMSLGLFGMQSGQFDKAVERFKNVIASNKNAGVEPYFYLAECYKQLGQKQEAIAAYQKCKDMIDDPAVRQKLDDYIKELKN